MGKKEVRETDLIGEELQEEEEVISQKASVLGKKPDLSSETLRKTFLAMSEDIRVVLIKLADRLHNMRTLGYIPEAKQKTDCQPDAGYFLLHWQTDWESGSSNGNWKTFLSDMLLHSSIKKSPKTWPTGAPTAKSR